jgi:8-oxo-dGTP diphosphatase
MTEQQNWRVAQAQSYGGVVINEKGQVLLRSPTNHVHGYVWTFAKDKPAQDEDQDDTATRAVYEATGYRTRIMGVLPGVYSSGYSSAAFFVMRLSNEKAGNFSEQTQAVQWLSFSHARAQVALSTNIAGRQRDLAILDAAECWLLNCLPLALLGMFPTLRSDWRNKALPNQHCRVELNITFSRMQAACIMLGYLPEEMEEKWFSFYENNVLYQHSSWTHICVDEIYFTELADGSFKATHALVNRDPAEYRETDADEDKRRIQQALRDLMTLDRGGI